MEIIEKSIVASIQMNCQLGEKNTNLKIARGLIEEAISQKARLIALPELFSTGYLVEPQDLVLAESIPGPTTNELMFILQDRLLKKEKPGEQFMILPF